MTSSTLVKFDAAAAERSRSLRMIKYDEVMVLCGGDSVRMRFSVWQSFSKEPSVDDNASTGADIPDCRRGQREMVQRVHNEPKTKRSDFWDLVLCIGTKWSGMASRVCLTASAMQSDSCRNIRYAIPCQRSVRFGCEFRSMGGFIATEDVNILGPNTVECISADAQVIVTTFVGLDTHPLQISAFRVSIAIAGKSTVSVVTAQGWLGLILMEVLLSNLG